MPIIALIKLCRMHQGKHLAAAAVKAMRGGAEFVMLAALAAMLAVVPGPVAQAADKVAIPNFWDPKARPDKPDPSAVRTIRFLTDDDFPPLNFSDQDGRPVGFAVDLARAVCQKLAASCTIQARRFDLLLDALAENRGDVVISAVPISRRLMERFTTTRPYLRLPARFVGRTGAEMPQDGPGALAGRKVAVVEGSAHEAYLKAFFPKAVVVPFTDLPAATAALKAGEADLAFADGMALAIWLGGSAAGDCCAFVGGPYLSARFFGEGIGFVVRRDDAALRQALDYALQAVWDDGTFTELYLRYFPIGFF